VTPVVWVRTDRATFEGWAWARAGGALPEGLRPEGLRPEGLRPDTPGLVEATDPDLTPVPPMVAASLALHGWAEAAVTVRLSRADGDVLGCFGLSGDLAAGVVRSRDEVRIGLFDVADLVDQIVALVPDRPPPSGPLPEVTPDHVRIGVLGADAAIAGWQQTLVGGQSQWRRRQPGSDPGLLLPVTDVRRELAADLRFALADCLNAGSDRG
jgi:hypothetical protein